uniref:Uncharacterized protein n=1 Tax=Cajanus cajan TaxID=3821 RepID=A0A151RVG2_CAJCA|nr:hypothetical protein KK1_031883 [Cajanus cajan]
MEFSSEHDAYKFYFAYAKCKKEHRPFMCTNCKAKFCIHLDQTSGKWQVIIMLGVMIIVSLIRSYCGLSSVDKAHMDSLKDFFNHIEQYRQSKVQNGDVMDTLS